MNVRFGKRKQGLTLIELMVVLAIVAVLGALLLPGIQQTREAARQASCKNNLKEIGLALHNYYDVHRTFPQGWVAKNATAETGPLWGWQTMILPFVEQSRLYSNFNFKGLMPAANDDLQTRIALFRCPSDTSPDRNAVRGNYGTSNYSGNHGSERLPGSGETPTNANGIFYWNSSVSFRDITDGTSHTFALGERSVSSAAGIWPGLRANRNENDAVTDCSHESKINSVINAFSSKHEGGAHFLLCDVSVRFVDEKIDSKPGTKPMGTFQQLSNRKDGQVVGGF